MRTQIEFEAAHLGRCTVEYVNDPEGVEEQLWRFMRAPGANIKLTFERGGWLHRLPLGTSSATPPAGTGGVVAHG